MFLVLWIDAVQRDVSLLLDLASGTEQVRIAAQHYIEAQTILQNPIRNRSLPI